MHFTTFEENEVLTRSGLTKLLHPNVIGAVRSRYYESTRYYHTWQHALATLSWVNHVCDEKLDLGQYRPDDLQLAALYHDAVYDTEGSPSNEERSIALMLETLATSEQQVERGRVAQLIRLTAKHGQLEREDVQPAEALFLDCDIASFGEPRWEVALWNDQNIAMELLHRYKSSEVRAGREAFLRGLLAKRSVFLSPYFSDRWEAQARKNITRLVERYAGFV